MTALDIKSYWNRAKIYTPALAFIGGFLFDIITLDSIDSWLNVSQQALYLCLITFFLLSEIVISDFHSTSKALQKVWHFKEEIMHFFLGSLLSVYTLFYFKSASGATALLFILLMLGLMVINELPRFQKYGPRLRSALLSLCWLSFLSCITPVLLGFVGLLSFFISILCSFALIYSLYFFILKKYPAHRAPLQREFLLPSLSVLVLFIFLYLFKLIPPIPLSIQKIGVYHQIKKEGISYKLYYLPTWWKPWQTSSQDFVYREGDKIHCFATVYSPTKFKDQVRMRWQLKDSSGDWQNTDVIPMTITGGREGGFRGYSVKSNYTEGEWRVVVETTDGRELGRIRFSVEKDSTQDLPPPEREWQIDTI